MNLDLKTISELQEKAEIILNRLMDAKEIAIEDKNRKSTTGLSELVRSSIIDINSRFAKIKLNTKIADKIMLLEELKSILFQIDGIDDFDRKLVTRKREIVLSRQIMLAVYHRALKVSPKEAGSLYGKDRATVKHSCKSINNLRLTDKKFDSDYSVIWEWAKSQDPNFNLTPKNER